jgi:hypothetical protein
MIDLNKEKESKEIGIYCSILQALKNSVEHPLQHGEFTMKLVYRDGKVFRFITTSEVSHMVVD